jgi:hypothetical protein
MKNFAEIVFASGVVVFVTLLVMTFRAGHGRQRTLHYWLVTGMLVVMIGLIYWVEKLVHGRSYDLIAFRTHMGCVSITLLAILVLAVLGLLLAHKRPIRRQHRAIAWLFILSLLPTVGTGVWLQQTLR